MDDTVTTALEVISQPDADPLDVAAACETLKSFADAVQLRAFVHLTDEADMGADPYGTPVDPTSAEISCALRWAPGTASARLELAETLYHELPHVLQALRTGHIDLPKAREIADRTVELNDADRTHLTERALPYAHTHTRAQLRAWLTRHADHLDPEAAAARRAAARKRRGVWLHGEPDGMATLNAYLTAEEAHACMANIRSHLANTDGTLNATHADSFIELLTGISPQQPIPISLIVFDPTPGPAYRPAPNNPAEIPYGDAEIAGYGPITAAHANTLCAGITNRIRLTPPTTPSTAYRPSPTLDRYVRTRDRHCRFPGCRRPARDSDLDHTIAYPTGRTTEENLHTLCRRHHRLKTHTGWKVRTLPGHTLEWTSPRGRTYTSHLDDP